MESNRENVHSIELVEFYLDSSFVSFGPLRGRILPVYTEIINKLLSIKDFLSTGLMESNPENVHSIELVEFYLDRSFVSFGPLRGRILPVYTEIINKLLLIRDFLSIGLTESNREGVHSIELVEFYLDPSFVSFGPLRWRILPGFTKIHQILCGFFIVISGFWCHRRTFEEVNS